ncbi:MAG: hypothetical protein ABI887_10890 [Burkholderiales bacterium]
MKHLRILILVLMSILLPIRGAVAATMLCPVGEGTSTAALFAEQGHDEMHADHSVTHHHASGEAPNDEPSSGEHPTTCHFCASGCWMASIVGMVPSLGQPGLTSSVTFPALTTRIPVFQSDGQDRPPRTI